MAAIAKRETEPFSDINITPMIDVMLVLLVMLILTIPTMTHKVPIDLPQPGPSMGTPEQPHRLEIARSGALSWDGRAIADAELKPLLAALTAGGEEPVLHMRTDPEARYERFDQVLAEVKRANIRRLGFVGDKPLAE
ncbi:biopolymer transporter ExbD [Sphingomonas cannabina]|uniref:ExbD/TolR family protein n=1 Tax=Sphingomonas cannabina TaxID=2899123 RepID=UPI001F48E23C|nr:biopolymer transporter ExbD [Sphingomonas cannabina]UIJ45611.1 biopolymer transporter ExbD [Sphingomonas cannabina]